MKLAEIKKELFKTIKGEEDQISVEVKIYQDEFDTFETEIRVNVYGDLLNQWLDGNEFTNEQDAMKRAKTVLKSVKGWFNDGREIEVSNIIEVYHG